ncbi:VTC domain-containing protein [Streptococcus panodentis]|uniref:Molecular chaperone n=1 Tax=Streptococcus panodentis TaxID=1581472 RepID=A0ABS5AUM2_9STRE|nr:MULTISPECIES: polyphosphate polymerase domain-containing protein [Streptococcus]KXT84966.1 hypothetical protein STRDD11_00637 [Streptococcus sp. DD11]MBP2620278.1 molecular chaperone [Streptococcus panodentis]
MAKKTIKKNFQRFESKYIIRKETLLDLLQEFEGYLVEDEHAYSTINNLYYDTPTYQIIRETLENPYFDEKLRLRTYEEYPTEGSQVFLEIKKKMRGIVYKRRIVSNLLTAEAYLDGDRSQLEDSQIREEIDWLAQHFGEIGPMMLICYNRYSMKGLEDAAVRITFDHDLTYRPYDLSLLDGRHGDPLLPADHVIMEVKLPGACPAWLSDILERYQLTPASFSKYGVAYQKAADYIPSK